MGNKVIQIIRECAVCGIVPEDGGIMWEMGIEVWCEVCCNQDQEQPDTGDLNG